jgi:serine/threonine protein phosphatase PrpC
VTLSGSTVCTVLFDGNRVHCANLGDSRAIKVQVLTANGHLDMVNGTSLEEQVCKIKADPLSEDHKPELPGERQRILENGGRIDSFHDSINEDEPIGPQRVWLMNQQLPGLAMSRSLGDQVAHSVGVSSIPEVKTLIIGIEDKFVVIGSDGVFEFLTNEDVARIVMPFYRVN